MVVINQNNNFNSGEYNSPEVSINSNLKRWFSRNIGLWKSNRTYFLEEERKTYNLCMYINIESLENLEDNLIEQGYDLSSLPFVIQYNKRDLGNILSVEELREMFNPTGVAEFEARATTGEGVFDTLKGIARKVLIELKKGG